MGTTGAASRGASTPVFATESHQAAAEVIYVEYPNEGHAFTKPETHRDLLSRVVAELRRRLGSN